ncbi:MAG: endonuclease/exonuclease/phosphatase family protein [Bacteroidales bacterium]|nr:endonuclease/exonuclease/phosphatase family protein [Bacteroidales bacterium]
MKKLIRFILITINLVAAVCLLLAYLCCWISPENVWWLSFFGLAYGYLMVILLFFSIFWLFTSKKKYALLSLAVVLLGWNNIWQNIQISGKKLPDKELENSIRIFSFNVHAFSQSNEMQKNGKKLNIYDYMNETGAEIICMQEFADYSKNPEFAGNISKKLNKPDYHTELPTGAIGIATYSSYPIIRKELIFSDKSTNACMCSDLLINGDTVRIYNVHLKSIGFTKEERELLNNALKKEYDDSDVHTLKGIIRQMKNAYIRRAQQVDILKEHVDRSPYPVIICGDFNDPPTSYSYKKIKGKRKDAFVEAGKGRSATYHIGRISSQRIDYILHSPSFRAYNYESPRVRLSDHYPVMCHLVKR